jgi:nucleoside 2-deoxyribosyltransferase
MKSIYLANSYGFSKQQRELLLPPFVQALESLGLEVWEPFARNNQAGAEADGYAIGQADKRDVAKADGFFGIVNGLPPDEGVMVELGMAIAIEKPIFLFRDDFRTATDIGDYPLNLMVFAGLPESGWKNYYYQKLEDLCDPDRPLANWARSK